MKLVRGEWQEEIYNALMSGNEVLNPVSQLQGKAKRYSWHYTKSFKNLLRRMQETGIFIERELGPRGGQWHAVYWIKKG